MEENIVSSILRTETMVNVLLRNQAEIMAHLKNMSVEEVYKRISDEVKAKCSELIKDRQTTHCEEGENSHSVLLGF